MSGRVRKSKKTENKVVEESKPVEITESVSVEPTPVEITQQVSLSIEPIIETTTEPKKGKRTNKKTQPIVAIVTPSGISGSFITDQRPLIAHIPVTSASLNFDASNLLQYNPASNANEVPKPYEQGNEEMSYLDGIPEGTGVESDIVRPKTEQVTQVQHSPHGCKLPSNYSEKLMVTFQDSNRYQKLPEKTEVACFWCCHSFQNQPYAIPSHILDELWYMYGNFCSPECATSYLFKERIDSHVQWERYALLNSLYADESPDNLNPSGIRPAPPREVLRMFGGSMDISEYRAIVNERRLRVDVLTPPMVSIIQTMDTKPIDFYDQNLKNVFIRNDIQHKYNAPGAQGLRLKRSKPVKSRESTVEWAMQIQQIAVGE